MAEKQNSWLVIGRQENWDTSLAQPIPLWGLKPVFGASFEKLQPGDIVWIYVTNPVKGVVGVAVVKDKYQDHSNLVWPEEIQNGKVIWPLRFRLQVLKALPRGDAVGLCGIQKAAKVTKENLSEIPACLLVPQGGQVKRTKRLCC